MYLTLIVRVIKSLSMRLVENVAFMEKMRNTYTFLVINAEVKRHKHTGPD